MYTETQPKSTKPRKILKILFLVMCTGFSADIIWMTRMCAVLVANHLRAVAAAFRPLRTHQPTEHLRGEYICIYI